MRNRKHIRGRRPPVVHGYTGRNYFQLPRYSARAGAVQLRVNTLLELIFSLKLQTYKANTRVQWVLRLEAGILASDTTPGTPGLNVSAINWQATPLINQAIIVTPELQTHQFGIRIKRTASQLLADQLLYTAWETAAAGKPTTNNFAIRGRLIKFDTENVIDPKGWVGFQLGGANTGDDEESSGSEKPAVVITNA